VTGIFRIGFPLSSVSSSVFAEVMVLESLPPSAKAVTANMLTIIAAAVAIAIIRFIFFMISVLSF
jgi:hypothetical protein